MNKKVIDKKNNTNEEDHPRKYKKKEINLHIVHHIKKHVGIETLKEINLSNILNLKVKDIEDIELGQRELSIKDISIICKCYKINPDSIFEEFLKRK